MKGKKDIQTELLKAEKNARSGKFSRLIHSPFLYPSVMVFNYVVYPLVKKGVYIKANTFFNVPVRTLLPSGTDILLNGIKSHDSEIRLTKYLTHELQEGGVFFDVGAHYGYYTLLACMLVGQDGKVYSIEASASSFRDLKENVDAYENIETFHAAAGDRTGTVTFYEYPGPYAEYNTIVPGAYTNQKWYNPDIERANTVPVLKLDDLFIQEKIEKATIKIDVEGGEASVLHGMALALKEKQLIIAMEYLLPDEGVVLHREAAGFLYHHGYKSHAITSTGELKAISVIDEYLREQKLNSDNIVFKKP